MIGDRIRILRESKKISQFAIAYSLGISQAAYSKIELGKTEVKVKHLYMIAAALDIPIYDLLPPALASGTTSQNEYLLRPLVEKVKFFFYQWYIKRKLKQANLIQH